MAHLETNLGDIVQILFTKSRLFNGFGLWSQVPKNCPSWFSR